MNARLRRSWKAASRRTRILITSGISIVLVAGLLATIPALPDGPLDPGLFGEEEPVDTTGVPVTTAQGDPTAGAILTEPPAEPVWPVSAKVMVSVNGTVTDVGGLQVGVTANGGSKAVEVETLGQESSAAAGVDGALFRIGETGTGRAGLTIGYGAFANAFGADWQVRLRLTHLPECALTSPDSPDCVGIPLQATNNTHTKTITGEVAGKSLIAITAASSGPSGDYGASTLAASQTWSAGGSSGDFTWSYQVPTPSPWTGGPGANVGFSYSSGGVDGRTAASNNQPSWIGEGFDYEPGYIERRYTPCASDQDTGSNNSQKTGDLCWFDDNAFLSYAGQSTELIKDATSGAWRPKNEDGSKIEHKTGGPNGDNNGEYWILTLIDGTKIWFGRNRLPGWVDGKTETKSVWTVPVFGNHSGEPCHSASFADSDCDQAWRWQVDYVEDTWGNTTSYFYDVETNKYGRNLDPSDAATYTRAGSLARIDYGTRNTTAYGTVPNQVMFTTTDRCLANCADEQTANWPDTPWDQECSTAPCTDKFTPTFWTAKRLSKVLTRGWTGLAYANIDQVVLRHSFRNPGDGTRAGLFLEGITRTGLVGGTMAVPEVTFGAAQMANRVDGIDNAPPMNWFRVASIITEAGGEILVDYSEQDCQAVTRIPSEPGANTWRCFPVWWNPAEFGDPSMDWFHKYVVDAVSVIDHTGGNTSPRTVTRYTYGGGAAWHYDDGNGLTEKKHRTWSQWRGYETVTTTVGDGTDRPMATTTLFHRGMHGDKKPGGGTKSVQTTSSDNRSVDDIEALAGQVREQRSTRPGSIDVLSRSVTDFWVSSPATATRLVEGRTVEAVYVRPQTVTSSTRLNSTNTWKTTRSRTEYNELGQTVLSADHGDVDNPADDSCIRTTYVPNNTKWIMNRASVAEAYAMPCTAIPATVGALVDPMDLITYSRFSYDKQASGQAPTIGAMTTTEGIAEWTPTGPRYVTHTTLGYDTFGRPITTTDATGAATTTTYTGPAAGEYVSSITKTNALGYTETFYIDRLRGHVNYSVDPNGNRTESAYDPLGRRTKVWLPGRSKSLTPNVEYVYQLRNNGPTTVTTKTLIHNETYVSKVTLYDSLMRQRQSQSPAVGGGRVVSDVFYDTAGRPWKFYDSYVDASTAPTTELAAPTDEQALPRVNVALFDDLGNTTDTIFYTAGAEKWRTKYIHYGDRTDVIPPQGGTVTSTLTDVYGRVKELRQYHGNQPTGTYDPTYYTYNKRGDLESWKDGVGNTWSTGYDFLGRVTSSTDPDRGITTITYDDANRVTSTKNAKGEVLAYAYDELSRVKSIHDGATTGPARVAWTYNNSGSAKGTLLSATRWNNQKAYTTTVDGYDAQYRPLSTTVTIPEGHGDLSGSYTFSQTYNVDGSPHTVTYPAAGGLPAETVEYYYDQTLGMPLYLGTNYPNVPAYISNTEYTSIGQLKTMRQGTEQFSGPSVIQKFYYEIGTERLAQHSVQRMTETPALLKNTLFTYNPAGDIRSISDYWDQTDPAANFANDTQCFKYDHLQRLKEAWTPAANECTTDPSLVALGGPAPYRHTYGFDTTGNRTSFTDHATPTDPIKTDTTYSYGKADKSQPHTLRSTETSTTGSTGSFTHTYEYDNVGNTISRPDGSGGLQTLNWDSEGHLTKVTDTDDGSELGTYTYGPDGSRLLAKDPTGETLYLGGMQLHDTATTAATAKRYYHYAGATIAVRTTQDGLTWLTSDHQGTNQLAISQDTTRVQQRRQDPYGNPRGSDPANWPDKKGFVGGEKDPTGLTHIGAREYDPVIGRFISDDPITTGDPQQANGYAYANNTPISKSDPSGLCITEDASGGCPNQKPVSRKPSDEIDSDSIVGQIITGLDAGLSDISIFGIIQGIDDAIQCAYEFDQCVEDMKNFVMFVLENPMDAALNAFRAAIAPVMEPLNAGRYAEAASALVGTVVAIAISGGLGKIRKILKGIPGGPDKKVTPKGGDPGDGGSPEPFTEDEMGDIKSSTYDQQKDAVGDNSPEPDASTEAGDGTNGDGDGDGGPKCNCFVEGTPVAMADGTTKPIEKVKPGDKVSTYNTDTGEQEPHTVTALFHKTAATLLEITVDTSGSSGADDQSTAGDPTGDSVSGTDPPTGQAFTVTPEHPFWEADTQTWTLAGDLEAGDKLLQRDGDKITVAATRTLERDEPFTVYNFNVDGTHNYYATTVDTLVHNCNDGDTKPDDIGVSVFRGIFEGHDGWVHAQAGDAWARGGHTSMEDHNDGNTDSIFVSFSRSWDTAKRRALWNGAERGIVLEVPLPLGRPAIDTAFWLDDWREGEFLVPGGVSGAIVHWVYREEG